MFSLGITEDDLDQVECWPENWPVYALFCKLQSQWRVGPGGATGLDYSVLMRLLDRMGLSASDYDVWFNDIQLMEVEALNVMHESH